MRAGLKDGESVEVGWEGGGFNTLQVKELRRKYENSP